MSSEILKTDFLIAGSGLAGLSSAIEATRYGQVILVTKSTLSASSSYWAQGGIAAVLQKPDTFQSHISDTLKAGRGYCNTQAVDILVKEGAQRVSELLKKGMPFEKEGKHFHLGMEGGHSNRRILHANGAATGKAMIDFLSAEIRKNPAITVLENAFMYDLISTGRRCIGAKLYLFKKKTEVQVLAKATILATGGYSGLFTRSTNPHTSTGDGLWLAYNHGAVLKDLEFVQFHPTAFYDKNGHVFLISEALRGEGARLINTAGERFMAHYPQRELSPRDEVSGEIVRQINRQKENYVYLDLRHLNTKNIRSRFPGLIQRIESAGIDIAKQGVPVAPAAHYCIGGIETDLHGYTGVEGLYACGEAAATGVHGANRLASNSLLECLVFGKRAVEHAGKNQLKLPVHSVITNKLSLSDELKKPFMVQKKVVTKLLNKYAGITRDEKGLALAIHQINTELKSVLYQQGNEYYFIRMKEMLKITEMILLAALARKGSLGVHFRSDDPGTGASSEPIRFVREDTSEKKQQGRAVSW